MKRCSSSRKAPIKTTFMELLDELSSRTRDDALVMSVLQNIFRSYKIRFVHTLAPISLAGETAPKLRRNSLRRRSSAWA